MRGANVSVQVRELFNSNISPVTEDSQLTNFALNVQILISA